MMPVIKGKGKAGYLTGYIPTPPTTTATNGTWEAKNSTIIAWLINSMEPRIGKTYLFYKTTKEIGDSVQEMYSDLKNSSQCFEIRSAIKKTKQGNLSVIDYFNILVELWHEMNLFYTINWECLADSTKYNKMVEKDRIFDFLHGPNPDLDKVCGRILGTKPLPSLRKVFAKVRREESRRKVMLHQLNDTILNY